MQSSLYNRKDEDKVFNIFCCPSLHCKWNFSRKWRHAPSTVCFPRPSIGMEADAILDNLWTLCVRLIQLQSHLMPGSMERLTSLENNRIHQILLRKETRHPPCILSPLMSTILLARSPRGVLVDGPSLPSDTRQMDLYCTSPYEPQVSLRGPSLPQGFLCSFLEINLCGFVLIVQ